MNFIYLNSTFLGEGFVSTFKGLGMMFVIVLTIHLFILVINTALKAYAGADPKEVEKQSQSDNIDSRIDEVTGNGIWKN